MGNNYFRVDDRLIHGQILARWAGYLEVDNIIAIDDKTAKNPMLKSIMTMAVPKNFKPFICTMEEGKAVIEELEKTDDNNLIIVRFPYLLTELCTEDVKVDAVNIGNVSRKKGITFEVASNIFLSESDFAAIEQLHQRGIAVSFKVVPDSANMLWEEVRKKIIK